MLFEVQNLSFRYNLSGRDGAPFTALNGLSHQIQKGDFQILTGPSGSGKTTLLNILGLIEPLQEGAVIFEGQQGYGNLTEKQRNEIRLFKLGFVFQSFQLFPVLSAAENVEYFLVRQGLRPAERRARVEKALQEVGLWDHRDKRPYQLSGGQKQRVAIARALAKKPQVILADEPTASLDQKTGREIMSVFKSLNEAHGVTILVSSHDPMVLSFGRSVLKLKDGRIEGSDEVKP